MGYLLNYGFTENQIIELKERYNESIIEFISENELFIIEKIECLKEQGMNINLIYNLMMENIRIFLETTVALKKKIKEINDKSTSVKALFMMLAYNMK